MVPNKGRLQSERGGDKADDERALLVLRRRRRDDEGGERALGNIFKSRANFDEVNYPSAESELERAPKSTQFELNLTSVRRGRKT